HSGAGSATVVLSATEHEILLSVTDRGVGFDVHAPHGCNGSLGLISMRERVRLVQGQFSVTSEREQGTRIEVCVPLPSEAGSGVAPDPSLWRAHRIGCPHARRAAEPDGPVMKLHPDAWDAFLYVTADGEADFDSSVRLFEQAAEVATEKRASKILV